MNTKMIELALNKLQKYYGATMVLEDITFEVQTGEKVGIVGGNGCGKSTLLKIIMGIEGYEQGMLTIKKGSTLGYLEQMPSYPDNYTVKDVLNTAFEKIDTVYEKLKNIEEQLSKGLEINMERELNKYSNVQALYESLGGYEKEEKFSKVCTGLKIDDSFKFRLFSKLSGGEKTTIILGKILLQTPDILLLDEPSNHLDLETMEWLENYLKEYKGIVIIVSHDRYFINSISSRVVELSKGTLTSYEGNYEYYKEKIMELKKEVVNKEECKEKKVIKTKSEKASKTTKTENIDKKKNNIEKQIVELEEKLKFIEEEMNKCSDDYEKLNALYSEKIVVQSDIDEFMGEYVEL
jgi:ATP-binding cassette subfamily F protein 3